MKKLNVIGLASCLAFLTGPVVAGDFDGSKPLLCATASIIECVPETDDGCVQVSAAAIDAPRFIRIDAAGKQAVGTLYDGAQRSSGISSVNHLDGKLILQGVQDGVEGVRDGVGWTMAIAEDVGTMVVTASGDEVAFVIFGACTTL